MLDYQEPLKNRKGRSNAETLYDQLAWLREHAQSGCGILLKHTPMKALPIQAALPTDRTNLTIILRGVGEERIINHFTSHPQASLFMGTGVTLVLDENITLMGSPNLFFPHTSALQERNIQSRKKLRICAVHA